MRFWNRWKLLGGYLARRERLSGSSGLHRHLLLRNQSGNAKVRT